MSPVLFADNFLAGSVLSLLLPTGLLILIAIWYVVAVKRVPEDTPKSSAPLPSSDVLAAADPKVETPPGEPPAADEF
ncbi:MAG TPA: hypothetical protein VIM18_01685 [Solirubrobacteraceae bacterium]|jgi:hypothetical protein